MANNERASQSADKSFEKRLDVAERYWDTPGYTYNQDYYRKNAMRAIGSARYLYQLLQDARSSLIQSARSIDRQEREGTESAPRNLTLRQPAQAQNNGRLGRIFGFGGFRSRREQRADTTPITGTLVDYQRIPLEKGSMTAAERVTAMRSGQAGDGVIGYMFSDGRVLRFSGWIAAEEERPSKLMGHPVSHPTEVVISTLEELPELERWTDERTETMERKATEGSAADVLAVNDEASNLRKWAGDQYTQGEHFAATSSLYGEPYTPFSEELHAAQQAQV